MTAVLVAAPDVPFEMVTREADNVEVAVVTFAGTELTTKVTVVLAETLAEPLALAVVRPLMLK
jgi:hypothetical protein